MLVEYLCDPQADLWPRGAFSTVIGLVNPPGKHGTGQPIQTSTADLPFTLQQCLDGTTPHSDPKGTVMVVPRAGRSGVPLYICADPAKFESTTGVLAVLDDRDTEVGGPKHAEQWRDWLRWSNILQFLTVPRHGESAPLRMAEVWTRKSADAFAGVHVPLSVVGSDRIDVAFAMPGEWEEVLQYTDASLAGLVTELAQRGSVVPEPGMEVGPDESIWQLELAWPVSKVAAVIDDDPKREGWLAAHGWTVMNVKDSDFDSLADSLSDQVGGNK
jgi:hypothetical protein